MRFVDLVECPRTSLMVKKYFVDAVHYFHMHNFFNNIAQSNSIDILHHICYSKRALVQYSHAAKKSYSWVLTGVHLLVIGGSELHEGAMTKGMCTVQWFWRG